MKNRLESNKAIFIRSSARPIPRIVRMMHTAQELGYECEFLGAYRETALNKSDTWSDINISRVGRYFPLANGKGMIGYFKGVIVFNYSCFRFLKSVKPAIVHVSDYDSFLGAWLFCRLFASKLIYNIHDNLAQRYPIPRFAKAFLNFIEGVFVLGSDVVLVPEQFRKDALPKFSRRNVYVVRNTPEITGDISCDVCYAKYDADKIRVFFAGWIEKGRGIDALLTLAEDSRLDIRVAGNGDADLVDRLKRNSNIQYLGYLDHAQIIEETKLCHFIYALYDPVREINIYAAPNKLAEALSCGKPVIINDEVMLSKSVLEYDCGVVIPYSRVTEVVDRLADIMSRPERYKDMCDGARLLFHSSYSWSVAKSAMINIYKEVMA